ncbi:MAG: hypothetical protein RLZZ546_3003 [Bacteroidota bacterium]|jgi:hypothetical protein
MEIVQISDNDNLLRRVPTYLPNYVKDDGTISSFAFSKKRDEDGLSVDLERMTKHEVAILDSRKFRLLRVNAGTVINEINDGLTVVHNPITDNEAHSLICGNISDGKKKQLLKNSVEVFVT